MIATGSGRRVTSSMKLHSRLRQELRTLKPGARFPSQPELAGRFKVSQGTVREALSALVHEGLLEQKRGSGTYVAEPPRRQVGIVIGLDISQPGISPFWTQAVQAFRHQFEARGLGTRIYIGHAGPAVQSRETATGREFWDDIGAHRLAAVVVVNSPVPREWIRELAATGLPIRQMGLDWETPSIDVHGRMIEAGVRHLLARGRRRIAIIDGALRDPFGTSRYAPVRDVLAAAGAETHPEWQLFFTNPLVGFEGFQGVQRIWQARAEKPDGLLLTMDVFAAAATSALQESRVRLPEELLLVAHALRHGTALSVPAARLEVDPAEFAERTAALLLADLGLAPVPPPVAFLPFRLIAETGEVTQFPAAPVSCRVAAPAPVPVGAGG